MKKFTILAAVVMGLGFSTPAQAGVANGVANGAIANRKSVGIQANAKLNVKKAKSQAKVLDLNASL